MDQVRSIVKYWQTESRGTAEHRISGCAFSILAYMDGDGAGPAMLLIPDPHPDDKAYHEKLSENWSPEAPKEAMEAAINDVPLHEIFYDAKR